MDTCDATSLPVPSCSLDSREHQITELAAHIHAANYRLLCLIAEFDRPDGHPIETVPKNSAELCGDTDIETLNRAHGLDIDAETCVFPGNGDRMDYAMAVEGLLQCDGALQLDPATGHYPAHFPPARE